MENCFFLIKKITFDAFTTRSTLHHQISWASSMFLEIREMRRDQWHDFAMLPAIYSSGNVISARFFRLVSTDHSQIMVIFWWMSKGPKVAVSQKCYFFSKCCKNCKKLYFSLKKHPRDAQGSKLSEKMNFKYIRCVLRQKINFL